MVQESRIRTVCMRDGLIENDFANTSIHKVKRNTEVA